ncbi:MAG: DNA primase small subunit PriS [Methanomassiliicoccales archaeon]|nr:DNA primase small subunit PriS [Methanomassiliicoccales archaeon]
MTGEVEFVMERFRRYYRERPPPPPERFGKREFGFMFFDRTYVQRHLAFPKKADLQSFLQTNVPAHCYYSSAYYSDPDAERMEDKGWLGADLIFDLDADHIPGAEKLSYPEMLARVKGEMVRLLDEYILGDLGFDEKEVRIVFSGGRGYHAHVVDPKVIGLRSYERREIVDYITGTDLSLDWLLPEEARVGIRTKAGSHQLKTRMLPAEGSGGWKGKLRDGLRDMFDEMETLGAAGSRERFLTLKGAKEEVVVGLFEDLFAGDRGRRGRDQVLAKGNLANLSDREVDLLLEMIETELRPRLAGEVDEPVTSDIKRLIRMPHSLHGKTGLRVVPMRRRDLDDFDPLRDATPDVVGDAPVRIAVPRRTEVRLRGERLTLEGETEVPEYAALFLLCRREATLAGK